MLFDVVVAALSTAWAAGSAIGARGVRGCPDLRSAAGASRAPDVWPRLSVIIPALNEESTLEPALRSLLASTYPSLEIIAVDDRSTDRTGEILDRLAAEDPRLIPLHIRELPPGWLGKVHALHQGEARASGAWLLFSDADVHFLPGALEAAIQVAEAERLDHLTAMPRLSASSLFLRAALVSFGVTLFVMARPHRIGAPGSKRFGGIGAFNLVRAEKFRQTSGFAWLKLEVADDMAIGKLMVDHGGRSRWYQALDLLELEWYASLGALVQGLEKNSYGIFSFYRPYILALKLLIYLPLMFSPMLAILLGAPWAQFLGLAALGSIHGLAIYVSRSSRWGLWAGILAPWVGGTILLVALFRSAIACWRSGGIRWRGTLYTTEELRAGQRIKLW